MIEGQWVIPNAGFLGGIFKLLREEGAGQNGEIQIFWLTKGITCATKTIKSAAALNTAFSPGAIHRSGPSENQWDSLARQPTTLMVS